MSLNIFFLLSLPSLAQEKETVKEVPGAHYESGWLWNVFFGKHWRDEWISEIEVEILDLRNFAGGLTPIKRGGGFQTKSLRLQGEDGLIYKFRSLDKDPAKVLPPELQGSVVASIMQDQISSAHPLAPIVVSRFLDEVELLHAPPKLVKMPDSELLGEFREEFGGLLGMIEIHPYDIENESVPGFEGADKVENTLELFERLENRTDEKIDETMFLKARLMDIYFGDWDRHTDQWKWIRYKKKGKEIWRPFPRDRDQPFAKFDGLLPSIIEIVIPQMETFEEEYPGIKYITWNGRFIDRKFLTQLDKPTWDSVAAYVKNKITDDLIEEAVALLPQNIYELSAKELIRKLKVRRDNLSIISDKFYNLLNTVTDVYATNDNNVIEVLKDNSTTKVEVFKRSKSSGKKKGQSFYSKEFDNSLLKELRIHMLGGDDKIIINGDSDKSPLIRVIDSGGEDEIIDQSSAKTILYDSDKKIKIIDNGNFIYDKDEYPIPEDLSERYEPLKKDRWGEHFAIPVLSFDSDNDFILGVFNIWNKYNFRAEPYEYQMTLSTTFATGPGSFSVKYESTFTQAFKKVWLHFDAEFTQLRFTKYYGYGNETFFDDELDDFDFYELSEQLFYVRPHLSLRFSEKLQAKFGASLSIADSELENLSLLNNFPFGLYGHDKLFSGSFFNELKLDFRDNPVVPKKGIVINTKLNFFPQVFDVNENFLRAEFDIRNYFSLASSTIALRFGGAKVFGDYPFTEGVYLGGTSNLRGFVRERFNGDAMLFGKAEFRTYLTDIKFVLKGKLGFNTFVETGRVYAENEDSDKWHPALGGGLWISYFDQYLITLSFANSTEATNIFINFGFGF